jgi:hypothetical protein
MWWLGLFVCSAVIGVCMVVYGFLKFFEGADE